MAGVKYGAWGRERYGVKPVKVDTLEVRERSAAEHDV